MTVPDNPELTVLVCPLCQSQNQPPKARLATGSFLAGYQIIQNIETYAQHETYLAEHVGHKLQVRLQTFNSPVFDNGLPADYFLTAMRKWLKVKQPNIVKVIEAGRNRTGIYFSAYLPIEGITLEDRLWRGGGIALKPTLHLAISICKVLTWLYKEHGLIYGGLNPRNIILTPSKDIYLAQMTLAPIMRERPPGLPLAELATGRPGFMSPEQLTSPDSLDCQSDMFSLGATLYQMLTGKPPYAALNRNQVQMKHKAPSLADPRTFTPDLPDKVVWLLEVLLAHDPKDRFNNWDTLIDILNNIEQGRASWSPQPLKSHSVLIQSTPKVVTIRTRRAAAHRATVPLYPVAPAPPAKNDVTGIIIAVAIVAMAVVIILLLALPGRKAIPDPSLKARDTGSTVFRPMPTAEPAKAAPAPAPAPEGQTKTTPQPQQPAPAAPVATAVPPPEPATATTTFWGLYNETRRYAKQNPSDYEGLLDRYAKLATLVDPAKPDLVARIDQETRSIQLASAGPLDDAQQAIREKVMTFDQKGQYDEAIAWLNQYAGPFVNRTKDFRAGLITSLTAKRKPSR